MAIFASRSIGYKVGLAGVIACFLVYLIGYASPYWAKAEVPDIKVSQGLWMGCIKSRVLNTCAALKTSRLVGWFHAVRLLESVGMCLMLGAGIYAVVVNCCSSVPRNSRALEGLALVGGISAFIGAMVFVGKYDDLGLLSGLGKLSWAFYLSAVGSAGVILASIVIFMTNKPLDIPAPGTQGVVYSGGYPSAVVVQSGRVQTAYPGPSVAAGQAYGGPAPVHYGAPPRAGYPSKN